MLFDFAALSRQATSNAGSAKFIDFRHLPGQRQGKGDRQRSTTWRGFFSSMICHASLRKALF
jgi:hypothetical protein